MYSGDQLPGCERFSQTGGRAGFSGQSKIVESRIHRDAEHETRDSKDRHCRSSAAKFGDGLETVDVGQEYIDYRQIKVGRFKGSHPGTGIGRMDSVAAFVSQRHHNCRTNRWIVFDNQDSRHARPTGPSDPTSTNIFFKIGPLGLGRSAATPSTGDFRLNQAMVRIAYQGCNTLFKSAHRAPITLLT
jgi:hypothetical protein